jgi:hypothetical protein
MCFLFQIDYGHPSQPNYPRPTSQWWFHCNEEVVKGNVSSSEPSTISITTTTVIDNITASSTSIPTINDTTAAGIIVSSTTIGTTVISTNDSNAATTSSDTAIDLSVPPAGHELDYSDENAVLSGIHLN